MTPATQQQFVLVLASVISAWDFLAANDVASQRLPVVQRPCTFDQKCLTQDSLGLLGRRGWAWLVSNFPCAALLDSRSPRVVAELLLLSSNCNSAQRLMAAAAAGAEKRL